MKKLILFLVVFVFTLNKCDAQWQPDIRGYSDSLVKVMIDSAKLAAIDSIKPLIVDSTKQVVEAEKQVLIDSLDFELVKSGAEVTSLNESILNLNTLIDTLSKQIIIDGDGTAEINSDSTYFRLKREGEKLWLTVSDKTNNEERIKLNVGEEYLELWYGIGNFSYLQTKCKLNY